MSEGEKGYGPSSIAQTYPATPTLTHPMFLPSILRLWKTSHCRTACLLVLLPSVAMTVCPAPIRAQSATLTTLHSFQGSEGANPLDALVLGSDGFLYGTTSQGGDHSVGTVFRITPDGDQKTLDSFGCRDGVAPYCAVVRGW